MARARPLAPEEGRALSPPAELTRRSATELAAAIRSGEVSAAGVVEVHIERLVEFGWDRAIAEDRFAKAREEALAADRRVREAGRGDELPPLLGVPCTIKESIGVEGMPNTAGVVALAERRAQTTAPAAQRLLDAGAILLGVTNIPELTLWIESENRLYGRTSNPYDPRRTAGGSSGGEGAAVGSGGSPIGLGTDIGGSIRLPAFFNGVYGHKPTPGLVPSAGHFPPAPSGAALRMFGLGPLARRADDLMPLLRIIAGPHPEDPTTEEIPLGDPGQVSLAGMRVVVSEQASVIPAKRELRRARNRAAEALEAAGARVERLPLKSARRVMELYLTALREGAGTTVRQIFEGEDLPAPGLRTLLRRRGPHTLATRLLLASEGFARWVPQGRTRKLIAAGEALTEEITGAIGDGVLLHPPFRRAAPRHGATVGRPWATNAASVFNLAGTPVTEAPLGLNRRGLPLGAQVVAAPGNDHVSIAVAMELERRLGGWVPPRTR